MAWRYWCCATPHPGQREFQVPFNFTIRGVQIPVGLGLITLTLFLIAVTNLFTKPVATMAGGVFSVLLVRRLHHFGAARQDIAAWPTSRWISSTWNWKAN